MGSNLEDIDKSSLAAALEQAADCILITDTAGIIEYVNPSYTALTGWTSRQAVGQKTSIHRSGVHPQKFYEALWKTILSGQPWFGEMTNRRKDGTLYQDEMSITPVRDSNGQIAHFIAIKHDVTERRLAEKAIRTSLEFAQSTVDAFTSQVCVLDENGTIVAVNQAWCEFSKKNRRVAPALLLSDSDIDSSLSMGVNYLDVCDHACGADSEGAKEFAQGVRSLLRQERSVYSMEYPCHSPSRQRWFLGRATRFLSDGLPRILVEHVDITERKQIENALLLKTALLEGQAEATIDGFIVIDDSSHILLANRQFGRLWGIPQEVVDRGDDAEAIEHGLMQIEDRAAYLEKVAYINSHREERSRDEIRLKCGRILDRYSSPFADATGKYVGRIWYFRDVTERIQTEDALSLKTALLEGQTEAAIDGILVVDESNKMILLNQQFGILWGIPQALLDARDDAAVVQVAIASVKDSAAFAEKVRYLYSHRDEKSRDEIRLKNGKILDRYSSPLLDSTGQYRGRIWYFRDVTERIRIEDALLLKTALLEGQTETSIDGILAVNDDDEVILVNRQFGLLFAIPEEILATRQQSTLRKCAGDRFEDPAAFFEKVDYLSDHRDEKSRHELRLRNGTFLDAYSSPLLDSTGRYRGRIWYFRDITEQKAAADRIEFLAYHDTLTELPDRVLMRKRLDTALGVAKRNEERVAVLFLDLDRFKFVNDSLGHEVGDLLLREVGARLKGCAREYDTVARVGGDEFVVVLRDAKDVAGVVAVAERIIAALNSTFVLQGQAVNVGCSVGISMYPEHGADSETLIKAADTAMYCAKQTNRNTFRFFANEMQAEAMGRLILEKDMRLALRRNEFFLVYQPQMEIATGKITGFEALIRWQHPVKGLVPPIDFIAAAENCGLILPIGEFALRSACTQVKSWQDAGLPALPVAVNVSAVQFRQPGFLDLVQRVLRETGLAPEYLELELTESVLMYQAEVALSILRELKGMGLSLAVDDFGTGYSSLNYLKQFPVNKLKIDRSFIQGVAENPNDAAIAVAIISMAKSMKLQVIAEGVETDAQLAFLREHRCGEIQGYHFSRPMTADQVVAMLSQVSTDREDVFDARNSRTEEPNPVPSQLLLV